MYREFHFSSDFGSRSGTAQPIKENFQSTTPTAALNWPTIQLNDPLHFSAFAVKSIAVPLTWWQLPRNESFSFSIGAGAVQNILVPAQNFSTNEVFVTVLNALINDAGGNWKLISTLSEDNPASNSDYLKVAALVNDKMLRLILSSQSSPNLHRLLGLQQNQYDNTFAIPANDDNAVFIPYSSGVSNIAMPPYLYARSSLMSASPGANIRMSSNSASRTILAKIPTFLGDKKSLAGGAGYLLYEPSVQGVFPFDGQQLDVFDIYFTRVDDDVPIDFKGYPFYVTLSLW